MNWIAVYKDGTALNQFENGEEQLFKDINQSELSEFKLGDKLSVSLVDGTFKIGDKEIVIDKLSYRNEPYRLIYFRRNRLEIGPGAKNEKQEVESFIGFQVTIDEKNYKVMVSEKEGKLKLHI